MRGLSSAERTELDRAIRAAEQTCRFEFSVFVGTLDAEHRADAVRRHAALATPARSVLLAVDPDERVLEVVTGQDVRRTLGDDEARDAVRAMQAWLAADGLVPGIGRGLALLAEHARP